MSTPARLKMGLSGLSIPNFIIRCAAIRTAVENNAATFVTPDPALAVIGDAISLLSTRQGVVELGAGPDETILRNQAKDDLHNLMRTLATYVASVANGNADIILLSGFDIVSSPSSVGILQPPNTLKCVADGIGLGKLKFSWRGVEKSTGYIVSITPVVDGIMEKWETSTAKRLSNEFTNLVSGQLYALRVATLSSDGQGPWSNIITHRPQ